jgi:hypothetical protein
VADDKASEPAIRSFTDKLIANFVIHIDGTTAVACSFIALAAWVRQLPFWLLNSCVVTECLQSGHLNVVKPFIVLMV